MVRVLLYLVLVAIFAFAAVWIVDRPGDLVVNWQGYRIETSVAVGAAFVAALAVFTVILWNVMRWILAGPEAFALFRRNRRRAKGYDAIARGVVAVGTGDARKAGKEASEARRLLGKEPLTLVLAAQAAQLSGDGAGAEAAFRAMTEQSETRSLGLRGLYVEAERRGDRAAAKALAEEAARQSPETPWAGQALFDFQCAEHDWSGALSTLERLSANRLVDKADARRRRTVLLTAQAMDGSADVNLAIRRAREAHGLAPDFVPAAALAARLLAEQGDHKKAMKIVETTWAKTTHPDLAEVYVHVRPGDAARDKLKRARSLSERSGDDPEGLIAVARAAMAARELDVARTALGKLMGVRPTSRACLLMAELEEVEHGESGRSREWLGRALRAPRDPAWVADGVSSETWAPTSPVTGRLDAFVWKIPVEESRPRLAAEAWLDEAPIEPARAVVAVAPSASAQAAAEASSQPDLPRSMPTLVDADEAEPGKAAASAPPAEKIKAVPAASKPAAGKAAPAKPSRPTAAVFPLSRPPDDPGPNGAAEAPDTVAGGQTFPAQRPSY
ncbi:heme biosynthesis protein HemY [Hansschlegelia zhihuaiae]|uniref:HemY N-terminal domain-containing protein n=1 Tax=Hansschlegelia zhihuaiae TaxID=405005 RepID=A0A4Q0MIG9_9HYPH|nr:heme biosynthesis HemY N-terminal domain-containing protein [Hansschlegelia zhihuaiae]RXF73133.1 hypothetical protein EK403_11635 [Hansschlegelia zhihuaiae]